MKKQLVSFPQKTPEGGFTIIEMLISLAIFSIVMIIAVGSLVSIVDANRKARTQHAVLDNVDAVVELMSREIREGTGYYFASTTEFEFTNVNGVQVVYRLNNNAVERSIDGGAFEVMTANSMEVDALEFVELDSSFADPVDKVQIIMKGIAGLGTRASSEFSVQTMVGQRYTQFSGGVGGGSCVRDIALVIDVSDSVCDNPGGTQPADNNIQCPLPDGELVQLQNAVKAFVQNFTISSSDVMFSVAAFDTDAIEILALSDNEAAILAAIDSLTVNEDNDILNSADGKTNIAGGLIIGEQQLAASTRSGVPKYVIAITDGTPTVASQTGGIGELIYGQAPFANLRSSPRFWAYYEYPDEMEDVTVKTANVADTVRAAVNGIIAVGVGINNSWDLPNPDNLSQTIDTTTFLEEHIADYPTTPGVTRFIDVTSFATLETSLDTVDCDDLTGGVTIFNANPF